MDGGFEWAFVGVYGPTLDCSRSRLWDVIAGFCCWWDLSRCFGGDFNTAWLPSDRVGDSHFSDAMTAFSDLIFWLSFD